jgi:hypothetical protein
MIVTNHTTPIPNIVTITSPNTVPNYGYYTVPSHTTGGNPTWTINPSNTNNHNRLTVKGDAEFEGDIKIKGKSLNESLDRIEDRLAILHPNEELEKRWEDLRALRNAYTKLEAELIEKEKAWTILKR